VLINVTKLSICIVSGHCIDFLDTWLLLVEKMVNPKLILDSIYPLPEKGNNSNSIKFNPTDYLKQMLKVINSFYLTSMHSSYLLPILSSFVTSAII